MNGFKFNAMIHTIALLSVTCLSSPLFAVNSTSLDKSDIQTKVKRLHSSAGCMGCHQGNAVTDDEYLSNIRARDRQTGQKRKMDPTVTE